MDIQVVTNTLKILTKQVEKGILFKAQRFQIFTGKANEL